MKRYVAYRKGVWLITGMRSKGLISREDRRELLAKLLRITTAGGGGEEERVRVEMLIVKVEKRDTQDRNVKKEEKEGKRKSKFLPAGEKETCARVTV